MEQRLLWTPARRQRLQAAVAYGIILILFIWPAPTQFTSHLIGNNIDNWIFFWNDWWVQHALTSSDVWYFSSAIFHPAGTSLIAHSHSLLSSLMAAMAEPLLGAVGAFNLVVVLGWWLGAVGMFWLVQDMTQRPFPAFIAGLVFTFAPYHLTQSLAHAHLGGIHWWPFFALFLRRALTDGRFSNRLLTALAAAATIATGLQLGVFLLLWTAVYLLSHIWQTRTLPWQTILWIGSLTMLLLLPLLWPFITNLPLLTDTTLIVDESLTKQTDLLAYWIPPTYHSLWGSSVQPIYERFEVNRAYMPYFGYTALLLAALALRRRRQPETFFWLGSGLLWLLLAAGSALRINDTVFLTVPLPYSFLTDKFPFTFLRSPDRFNLLVVFSLAVLAGLGAAKLQEWLTVRNGRIALTTAAALLLLEYAPIPLPMWTTPPDSPFLHQIASDEATYAVANLPLGYTQSKIWLYYQTQHTKPIVEGHVSRFTPATYRFIQNSDLLRRLYPNDDQPSGLPTGWLQDDTPLTAVGPAIRQLSTANIRYLLLHKPYTTPDYQAQVATTLPLIPIYEDDILAAYDLTQPRPYQVGRPATFITPAVALLEAQPRLDNNTLTLTLLTELQTETAVPIPCQLQTSTLRHPFSLFTNNQNWTIRDLYTTKLTLPLPTNLPAGLHPITLTCANQPPITLPDALHIQPTTPPLLAQQTPNTNFDDQIQLTAVAWDTTAMQWTLRLHWQATTQIDRSYKLFVHILDTNNTIVRQIDTVPCDWRCPTDQWQVNQTISDTIHISLSGLPLGDYRFALGWYNPETGIRLPATSTTAVPYPDNYVIFPDTITITDR